MDHTAGYIHIDVREAAEPVLWVYRNGRAVLTTTPFQEVVICYTTPTVPMSGLE